MFFGIPHYYILAYKGSLSSSEMPRLLMHVSAVFINQTLYTRAFLSLFYQRIPPSSRLKNFHAFPHTFSHTFRHLLRY